MNAPDHSETREPNTQTEGKHEAKSTVKQVKDVVLEKTAEARNTALDKASELANSVRDVKDSALHKAHEAKDVSVERAHQAAEAVSRTTSELAQQSRRIGSAAWDYAADNALPLGLIGLGAGLLLANARNRREPADDWRLRDPGYPGYEADLDDDYAVAGAYPLPGERTTDNRAAVLYGEREHGRGAYAAVKGQGRRLYGQAHETLDHAQHALSERASRGRDYLQHGAERLRDSSRDLVERNPLAIAFGTLLAGVGVGLMLPATTREDQWLAPSRERARRAIGKVRDTAQDVGQVAKQTAHDTWSAVEGQRS